MYLWNELVFIFEPGFIWFIWTASTHFFNLLYYRYLVSNVYLLYMTYTSKIWIIFSKSCFKYSSMIDHSLHLINDKFNSFNLSLLHFIHFSPNFLQLSFQFVMLVLFFKARLKWFDFIVQFLKLLLVLLDLGFTVGVVLSQLIYLRWEILVFLGEFGVFLVLQF